MKKLLIALSFLAAISQLCAAPSDKRELAKAVLAELGVAKRFDVYLTRGADQGAGGDIRNPKLQSWLQSLWIQELGWTKVEDSYINYFEAKFSEFELKELLELSKNPTLKKLLKEEAEAFRATSDLQNKTFAVFWRRYNALEFSPPPEVMK